MNRLEAVTLVLPDGAKGGGPDRDRTGDLMNAIQFQSEIGASHPVAPIVDFALFASV